jgi:L-threonylcarbamoyladenylate synthase
LPDLGHKDVIQNSVNFNVLMEQMQIYETLESQLKYKIKEKTARIGIISLKHLYFSQNICENLPICQIQLSPVGDLKEAASNLYGALHQLDQMELDVIFAECMPEKGIGSAINDRLGRAAVR